jgi:hypothetical protein
MRVQKVKQILTEHFVPETAPFGTVFVCKDTQQVWLAVRSGEVLNLSDLLDGKHVLASKPARNGRDGKDGLSIKGEPGRTGPAGRDGKDGLNSVVPGPIGPVGPAGAGQPGPQGPAGADSATVLADARAEIATLRAEFANLKLVVNAIHDQNRQADSYIEFLRARSAARKEKQ